MPKLGVHSAPEYVVGTETSGSPVVAEAALAVSIAEPPPIARSAVGAGRHLDPVRRHLAHVPAVGELDDRVPARARDEERPLDPELGEHRGQLGERPADDHGSRSRANSTNARAARVSARPLRGRGRSRASSSSPSTRASASVPAARSDSTDEREMNVTP